MNVYQRLNAARADFHSKPLKKSGHNKFAGYDYFELGDFVIPALNVFSLHGLTSIISFGDVASMTIVNNEKPEETIVITSPMSEANLKGCHAVQNLGAVQTYLRRYLWVAALEIVEHDALDATTGLGQQKEQLKIDKFDLYAALDAVEAAQDVKQLELVWKARRAQAKAANDRPAYDAIDAAAKERKLVLTTEPA